MVFKRSDAAPSELAQSFRLFAAALAEAHGHDSDWGVRCLAEVDREEVTVESTVALIDRIKTGPVLAETT